MAKSASTFRVPVHLQNGILYSTNVEVLHPNYGPAPCLLFLIVDIVNLNASKPVLSY